MKEYILNEYYIEKDWYLKYKDWYKSWCRDNAAPIEIIRSNNLKEVIKEYEANYEEDHEYINSIYHYEVEEIDQENDNYDTIKSSSLCSNIFTEDIYKKTENDLIFNSYYSSNKKDEELIRIIVNNIDSDLYDIKEKIIENVVEKLNESSNKDFILEHVCYKLYDYISEKTIYTIEDIQDIERKTMLESGIFEAIKDNRYSISHNIKDDFNIYYSVGYEGFEQVVINARIININELQGKSIEYIEKSIKLNIVDVNYETR